MRKKRDEYLGDGVMPIAGCDCPFIPVEYSGYTYGGVDNVGRIKAGYEPIFDYKTPGPEKKVKSRIHIVRAGVLDVKADAIVNAANKSLLGGGGVNGAIHKAAGPELLEECRKLNGCRTGNVKITRAYNIKNASFIIHAIGPVYHGRQKDAGLLASCYYKSLELALKNGCKSIAFSGISTGGYGYPIEEAAEIAMYSVMVWYSLHRDTEMDVYFCCFREEEAVAYEKVFSKQKFY